MRAALRLSLAPALLALPATACAAGLGGGDALGVSLGRIVTALVVSLMVAALAILLIRQKSGRIDIAQWLAKVETRRTRLKVLETRRLSPHADICLVRDDDTEYLLLLGSAHAQVLRERAWSDATAGVNK